jgi:hypothetical protein
MDVLRWHPSLAATDDDFGIRQSGNARLPHPLTDETNERKS